MRVETDNVVVLTFSVRDGERLLMEAGVDAPFVYLHGRGALIASLEEALTGREVGERFEFALDPSVGFGVPRADPERVIPRDVLPEGPLAPGLSLTLRDDDGEHPAWVVREVGNHVVVSLSHPLSAKAGVFEAEVLKVREATVRELERGFASE